jgi:hypothetical protein
MTIMRGRTGPARIAGPFDLIGTTSHDVHGKGKVSGAREVGIEEFSVFRFPFSASWSTCHGGDEISKWKTLLPLHEGNRERAVAVGVSWRQTETEN